MTSNESSQEGRSVAEEELIKKSTPWGGQIVNRNLR